MSSQGKNSCEFDFKSMLHAQNELNRKLLKRVKKAVVFIDVQFAEWFSISYGLENLIKNDGALNIREFSAFEKCGEEYLKVVFFISQPLHGIALETLKDICNASKFQNLIIITNVSPNFYEDGEEYLDKVQEMLLISMGNMNYTVEILDHQFPFLVLPFDESDSSNRNVSGFLNPLASLTHFSKLNYQILDLKSYTELNYKDVHDFAQAQNASINLKDQVQSFYKSMKPGQRDEVMSLVYSLNCMLEHFDAKDDCFSVGLLSKIVAHELNNVIPSKNRRKNGTKKASLLLIDRNLDLSTVALFHNETVFDKMNNLLPNLNDISNDLQIDLGEMLFNNKSQSMQYGSFFHYSNKECCQLIESILLTKPKECLLDIYRKLNELLPIKSAGKNQDAKNRVSRITADNLKTQIKTKVKEDPKCLFTNLDLIQVVSSYCLSCDNQRSDEINYEKLISYLKMLTKSLLDRESPSLLSQLYEVFKIDFEKSEEEKRYTFIDLLVVLVYVYGLLGKECFYGIEEENRIKRLALNELNSLLKCEDCLNKQKYDEKRFFETLMNDQTSEKFIESFFENLNSFVQYRSNLKRYKLLYDGPQHQTQFKPIIRQISEELIKTKAENNADDLVDIEHRSSGANEGIKDLFKSFTLSYLKTSSKVHPLNNDMLIIYFIGGITSYEMKIVKEVFKDTPYKVLIGSSHFYNHRKLLQYAMS